MKRRLGDSRAEWSKKEEFVIRIQLEESYQKKDVSSSQDLRKYSVEDLKKQYKDLLNRRLNK